MFFTRFHIEYVQTKRADILESEKMGTAMASTLCHHLMSLSRYVLHLLISAAIKSPAPVIQND